MTILSGIAAMMVAADHAHRRPHRGDIVLALVADEESASLGTAEVLRHVRTDVAIVCEPSGLDITVAHKAITRAGAFLTGLDRLATDLATKDPHALLGHGSVHAGVITGGQETSSYPDRCMITVERRTLPGEDGGTLRAEFQRLLNQVDAVDDLGHQVAITLERQPFAAPEGSAIVDLATQTLGEHLGRTPIRRGEPFWTACALLAEAGIDTVLFGVDGGGAHAATEWVPSTPCTP